jgi:hypothetical protein
MRRNRTVIVMLLAMTVLATAATALAKPPDGKGKPEPSTMEGTTCADSEFYDGNSILVDRLDQGTFSLSISGEPPCVDVINVSRGTWTVDVNVGSARRVIVQLRSSTPGDWCWAVSTKDDTVFTFENTPPSVKGACPFGGAAGESIPDEDPALAFTVAITGSTKTPVEITVTLPPLPPLPE